MNTTHTTQESPKMVLVSEDELVELRTLKQELPAIIAKAKEEGGMERLKMLNQKRKENPEQHREQSKRRYERKKEEILAKRREAYRLKKEAKTVVPTTTAEIPDRSSVPAHKTPGPQ
jgi:putative hemolysin